jgi:hypothetical protein
MSHLCFVTSCGLAFLVFAVGCPEKVPPTAPVPAAAPAPTAGVVSVEVDPEAVARAGASREPVGVEERVLQVLDGARERAVSCYTQALQANPYLYGEVLVRLVLDADGGVIEASSRMDTVSDLELVHCVERLVQGQHYPAPGGEGLELRYPFLFSSDLTPPEVVRAMKAAHGLLDEEPEGLDLETLDGGPTGHGTVETW